MLKSIVEEFEKRRIHQQGPNNRHFYKKIAVLTPKKIPRKPTFRGIPG
jgi:hypothetical protein